MEECYRAIGVIKADTRTLDYSSHGRPLGVPFGRQNHADLTTRTM